MREFSIEKMAQRLRNERKRLDNTLEEVSTSTNIHTATLSRYERGLMVPSARALFNLSSFYNTSVDWFLGISNRREL